MKTFLSFVLVIVLGLHYAAGAANVGVQMDSVTHVLTPTHADFFSKNTPTLLPVVGNAFGALNVSYVSSRGDDTAAINNQFNKVFKTIKAALSNAVDNSVIYIMPETYPLTGVYVDPVSTTVVSIPIPMLLANRKNVSIIGPGVRITGSGHGTYLGLLNCTNVTVEGLTFDLVKPPNYGNLLTTYYCGSVMLYNNCENITFRNVSLSGSGDQGITSARRVNGLFVYDSRFYDIGTTNAAFIKIPGNELADPWVDGTAISGLSSRTVIQNCYFDRCYRACEWDEAASDTVFHSSLIITGNTISNCLDYAVGIYSPLPTVTHLQNVIISDNIIHCVQDTSGVDTRDNGNRVSGAIIIAAGQRGIIRNNTIYGFYDDSIQFNSASPINDWLIDGNLIQGTATSIANGANRGIRIVSTRNNPTDNNICQIRNVTITRNQIRDIGGNGIYVSGQNIVVDGNHLWNVGKLDTTQYRFFVNGNTLNTSNVVFRNNYSSDDRVGTGTQLNVAMAATAPNGGSTSPKQIIWGKGNITYNVDLTTYPTTIPINSGSPLQTYIEGKQILTTLVAGYKLVTYPLIKANSNVKVTCNKAGLTGAVGALVCTNLIAGTSFEIRSTSATDVSDVIATIDSPDTY